MIRLITITLIALLSFCNAFYAQDKTRPQEPLKPYPYFSENIYFSNPKANNIKLAGTLTLPRHKKNPTVAILISGSGAQDRNSEIKAIQHKPFLVLSHYLTSNGIAVLRYDDRGVAQSEGDFSKATTFDFASDVEAAVAYLKTRKDVNTSKIGLIGHSEGGLIAPIVASQNKNIAFVVLLAGPGVKGQKILESQSWKIGEVAGATTETLQFNKALTSTAYKVLEIETEQEKIAAGITAALTTFKTELEAQNNPYAVYVNDALIHQLASQISAPWLRSFIITEPKIYLKNITCPVLALNGSKDLQVLPKLNLESIKNTLKQTNNQDVTIKELKNLNHLFQTAKIGSIEEYSQIEETFAEVALKEISNWINARF